MIAAQQYSSNYWKATANATGEARHFEAQVPAVLKLSHPAP